LLLYTSLHRHKTTRLFFAVLFKLTGLNNRHAK
jgi:hypothetical protein